MKKKNDSGKWQIGSNMLALLLTVFLVLFANLAFWKNYFLIMPVHDASSFAMSVAMICIIAGLIGMVFGLCGFKYVIKPAFTLLLLMAASAAYFMDRYGAMVDRHALQSVFETNFREGSEWLSWRMLPYFFFVAGIPIFFLWRTEIQFASWPRELLAKLGYFALCLALLLVPAGFKYQSLASLARNHPEIRHQINPYNVVMAIRNYLSHSFDVVPDKLLSLGADATKGQTYAKNKPRFLVVVIGESARAESFSFNGYDRLTNPLLSKRRIHNFNNVSSCGTNTATSLPCMFSNQGRENYDEKLARSQESLVDVIGHAGLHIEWKDNNTGSKKIATRIEETEIPELEKGGPFCPGKGCYDGIFFKYLEKELEDNPGDMVLVLHPIGSHGPAYYERYPKEFEKFKPACRSGDLQDCSRQEVLNAYDNTIVYTDYVLDGLIQRLQAKQDSHDVAMLYVSDHGESTGENGIYLHGTPYVIAPSQQTQVPMLLWASDGFFKSRGINTKCLDGIASRAYSHDNFFHSVLGLLDLKTSAYDSKLDIFKTCTSTN